MIFNLTLAFPSSQNSLPYCADVEGVHLSLVYSLVSGKALIQLKSYAESPGVKHLSIGAVV